ncbi:PIF1-like helicase domain-containing protein [Hirsutella rhossiliensis]|uniref:ATP-dependent DNA helicase n=1 Tax=Hirsutella rhossiliensis TaxID=111463 RepID=A0A9P8SEH4_9HYPO|nr:PIF1-like helicase domain-containing protein [Hirsutella rhossiliensis]KAH0958984.1 PIF1-like helicase domain-containing protein [Hirsutella rhossiliensis]
MFALDGPPEVSDAEKLRFACNAVGGDGAENDRKGPRAWIRSAEAGQEGTDVREPYIHVCRGDEFADSLDASFFAKTFPTLLPFGFGGPRLAAARAELETSGKTTDDGVKELLRCLSLYGYRQPMSRELRLSMRRKIQSLILCRGVPAIWFTLNPNDITNPVKLRLAAYRTRDPAAAEAFLQGLDKAFKRARLAISDPLSSAEFFHREMTLFFEHYVRVGEESVFGRISHYYGAVETNERGALHVHGLLWLQGNVHLSSMLADIDGEDQAAYRERIVRYVDSVFSEDLDQEGFCAMQAERSVTSDISQFLGDERQFSASFDEEANFCAGATQIHTHSPTCVNAWAFLNVSLLYWQVFRQWPHLRRESGAAVADGSVDESILVEEAGQRICRVEAYRHRGDVLRGLCLYDYVSLVLRRPGKQATVCLDGYLSKDFDEDDEGSCYRRAAVQHLALFVPWTLAPRISCFVDNVQLLRRSAEDAKRDARQWAASSGDGDPTAVRPDEDGTGEVGVEPGSGYQADSAGSTNRLIDVVRSSIGPNQITAGSPELTAMMQELSRFQQSALSSSSEVQATILPERGPRRINIPGGHSPEPPYRRKPVHGTGDWSPRGDDGSGARGRSSGASAGMEIRFGASTSFLEAGKALAARLTLNKKQAIAFLIICRQLDLIRRGEKSNSRVIEALVELFASKDQSNRLMITATSGTAAARINGITIHSACGFSKDLAAAANAAKDLDGVRLPKQAERFVDGQSRMDWQEKDVLVIDEVSMLGARTLHAVNEQLCRLRGSHQDFGGIPIVLFCGDFHQFRPVQERSILLPSTAVSWDVDSSFKAETRHQHDKAHALWKRFTTTVMLDEQDRSDLDLLNSRCYREGRRIPWETCITVVTPLNRNRWNLNMEASLAFRAQQRSVMRIFISDHTWKEALPTEEEAIMMLNQGDDSAIPVPAVFMFVPGMPVVVNHNTHQGLKLVNGAGYTALEVVLDKSYPGHRITADTTCDPYSLYVQLSRCPTLDGIMLVSKLRERDLVGNKVPDEMTDAEARLGQLSDKTVREASGWLDVDSLDSKGTGLDV